jgi:hypothetical protein
MNKLLDGQLISSLADIIVYDHEYLSKYKNIDTSKQIVYDENDVANIDFNKNLIFFTKIDFIQLFIQKILPNICNNFILITHNGDQQSGHHEAILNNEYLVRWYGQNMDSLHKKVHGIPIGLENRHWGRVNTDVILAKRNSLKVNLLYLNFTLRNGRKNILDIMINKGFKINRNLSWASYIEELSTYKFCLCPAGNGTDTHRLWECLYLGVIPIIKDEICFKDFKCLPILFVNDYDCVTVEFLNQEYERVVTKRYDLDMLNIDYWRNRMTAELNKITLE